MFRLFTSAIIRAQKEFKNGEAFHKNSGLKSYKIATYVILKAE